MDTYFVGKNVVVTGAGQGIGNELCKLLHRNGAKVTAVSRTPAGLDALSAECPGIVTIAVNLADWKTTKQSLASIKHPIDGLVNNAGIAIIKPLGEISETDFDDTFNVNIKALFNVCQTLLPVLANGSSIVNVSSIASTTSFQGHSVYSATKAAVDSLTRSLALELAPRKIRVNSVNPTVILTRMGRENWSDPVKADPLLNRIPLNRFGEVEEVCNPIMYLLSDKSSFVNGHCLPIEGGFSAV